MNMRDNFKTFFRIVVYVKKMKIITLNSREFKMDCQRLLDAVLKTGFKPDLIVSIATGGDYVVREFGCDNDVEFVSIKKQRKATRTKNKLHLMFYFLKRMPYFISNTLRKAEHMFLMFKHVRSSLNDKKNITSFEGINVIRKVKNILIVDDAVDSGSTMVAIVSHIEKEFPGSNVCTASIVNTFYKPLIVPDVVIYDKCLVRFPWSKDYKNNV